MTTIKEAVLSTVEQHINEQNAKGLKNYGQTLDDCPVDSFDWQQMIIEEMIDALQYQQKEIGRLGTALTLSQQEAKSYAKLADKYREGILK